MAYLTTTYDANGFFHLNSPEGPYVGYKPDTYDEHTATTLFVWTHGCGGNAEGDLWTICPPATRANQSYIGISMGGRDGDCWDINADNKKVLAAIDHVSKYFNIDPRRIILGGYSSGGDLTYYTAFYNAKKFAGIIVENTSPFRDTTSTQAKSLAAAAWKFNVAHIAHLQDGTYPIAGVRAETDAMEAAGFPMTRVEKPGTHFEADTPTSGTNHDLITFGLPFIDAGWLAPGADNVLPVLPNFAPRSTTVKYPKDQLITESKVVPAGYANVKKGTYKLKFYTRTTYSGQSGFCVDITISNDNAYDISWEEMTLDLQNNILSGFGQCTIDGTTGTVVVHPTPGTATIAAYNKVSLNLCCNRAPGDNAVNQVLIKSVQW
jgi:pimeloyl-ACP methyl ester carboxylesterase